MNAPTDSSEAADSPDASKAADAPDASNAPDTSATPDAPVASDFSLDAAPVGFKGAFTAYVAKIRSGDLGPLPALLGFVVLCSYFAWKSDVFLTERNLANLLTQSSATIVIAMGLVFVLLLGEIDLSAGSSAGVCAVILAVQLKTGEVVSGTYFGQDITISSKIDTTILGIHVQSSVFIPVVCALAAGAAIGTFTGFLVARVGIPSFVVTLALFLAWQGVVLKIVGDGGNVGIKNDWVNGIVNSNLSKQAGWIFAGICVGCYAALSVAKKLGRIRRGLSSSPWIVVIAKSLGLAALAFPAVYVLNKNRNAVGLKVLEGVPKVVVLIVVLGVVLTFVLTNTSFGRHFYAVGGNAEAARRAGINVKNIRMSAFVICSTLAAIGGIVLASRLNSVDPQTGGGNQLLFAVAAAVIGGTSLFGGRGKVRDAILGGLVVAVIDNGLGLLGYDAGSKFVATGLVLLVAASVDALSRKTATR